MLAALRAPIWATSGKLAGGWWEIGGSLAGNWREARKRLAATWRETGGRRRETGVRLAEGWRNVGGRLAGAGVRFVGAAGGQLGGWREASIDSCDFQRCRRQTLSLIRFVGGAGCVNLGALAPAV